MFKENYSILLVDDETFTRDLISKRLGQIPGITIAASLSNGISARNYLLEHAVDIIITDIMMPFMDGLELSYFLSTFDPGCQIIIMSGYSEFEYARKAIQYGAKDYLLKPVKFQPLIEVIEKCCAEIRSRREHMLTHLFSEHKDLEQQLFQTFVNGSDSSTWFTTLKQMMMTDKAVVVRLEIKDGEKKLSNEEFSLFFKNILSDVLAEPNILRLAYDSTRWEYLILSSFKEYNRSVKSLSEYLNRILSIVLEITEVCTVNSATMLANYKSVLEDSEEKDDLIEIACKYMEEHLAESITRDDMAARIYLTPSYFSFLFKKKTGMSYSDYMIELKVKRAKELLKKNMTIREVALAVGYHDPKYFTDIFSKKTGKTPSVYRFEVLKNTMKSGAGM